MTQQQQVTAAKINENSSLDRRMLDWLFSRIFMPFLILMLMWPIYKWFFDLPHSFERAFAHGDLLIFSALILLESAAEAEYAPYQSVRMGIARRCAWLFAIGCVLVFGFMKYSVMLKEPQLAISPEAVIGRMKAFACLNCTIAVVSILFSAFAYWKNVDLEKTAILNTLAEQGGS